MPKTTPFYPRLSELNTDRPVRPLVRLPVRPALRPRRPSTSTSRSATRRLLRHLAALQVLDPRQGRRAVPRRRDDARHPRSASPGRAQYTIWCDDRGFVLEDGVVFRHSDNEFFMTTAEPNLGYFARPVGRLDVSIEDVTEEYGDARRAGSAVARDPAPRSRPRSTTSASSTSRRPRSARPPVTHLAHRLHRRPRLRGLRRRRRRARRARRRSSRPARATASGRSASRRC